MPSITDLMLQQLAERGPSPPLPRTGRELIPAAPPPGLPDAEDDSPRIYWADHWLPVNQLKHCLSFGSPDTGKTLHLSCQVVSILQVLSQIPNGKVIFIDAKGDWQRMLQGLRRHRKWPIYYRLVDIGDSLSGFWDIASDYQDYQKLTELGFTLFPATQGENAFFQNAARAIVIAVMIVFTYLWGNQWTIRDLYNALTQDLKILKQIIAQLPHGGQAVNRLLETEADKTLDSILLTIRTEILTQLRVPAAHCFHAQGGAVSVRQFLESPQERILVLSLDSSIGTSSKTMIRGMFKRMVDLINARPGEHPPNTFVVLDELEFLGKLMGLQQFMIFSRSKGGRGLLASQTLDGLYEVYGQHLIESILGCIPMRAAFHCDSVRTREFLERDFGQYEFVETQWNRSYSGQGVSVGYSQSQVTRPLALASAFKDLPFPSPRTGLWGYYSSPFYGAELNKFIPAHTLAQLKPRSFDYDRMPLRLDQQLVEPWTPAERARFLNPPPRTKRVEPSLWEQTQPVLSLFEQILHEQIFDWVKQGSTKALESALLQAQSQGTTPNTDYLNLD